MMWLHFALNSRDKTDSFPTSRNYHLNNFFKTKTSTKAMFFDKAELVTYHKEKSIFLFPSVTFCIYRCFHSTTWIRVQLCLSQMKMSLKRKNSGLYLNATSLNQKRNN